jgi:hypothetical protein
MKGHADNLIVSRHWGEVQVRANLTCKVLNVRHRTNLDHPLRPKPYYTAIAFRVQQHTERAKGISNAVLRVRSLRGKEEDIGMLLCEGAIAVFHGWESEDI